MFTFAPDPYRQLTRRLTAGPEFVNTALDKIGHRIGMPAAREGALWEQRIQILEQIKPKLDKQSYPFLSGYLHLQGGGAATTEPQMVRHYEQALEAFGQYTKQTRNNPELQHVALWQTALLHQAFGETWPKVEEELLEAFEACPTHAEAIQSIIDHHFRTQGPAKICYIFVRYCRNHFYQQPPAGKWFTDLSFYEWRVLEYHLLLSRILGKPADAVEDFKELRLQISKYPDLFTAEDVERIKGYQQEVHDLTVK